MSGAVAIFVKTPGHSPVKTRLAATHGREFAEAWHWRAAAAVAAVVREAADRAGLAPYWAVAERAALDNGSWSGFACIVQGGGSLGERMARVHRTLTRRHGFALLIGADAPQIRTGDLVAAAAWLADARARLALGPACDGGFWLFGGNRVVPPRVWRGVAYSRSDTADAFCAALDPYGEWLRVVPLTDLDRAEDLAAQCAELALLPAPLPEQAALLQWLKLRERESSAGAIA
jgi:glycosyltransferase A (GT-A) superfamily protein (DUF2064 family)